MAEEWRDAATRGLWVGLGGFLGANARYWLGIWIQHALGIAFPCGTLTINVTGSFLLGLLLGLPWGGSGAEAARLLLGAGFLGAYTTFSTFSVETLAQADQAGTASALLYVLASVAGGLLAAWLGLRLGRLA